MIVALVGPTASGKSDLALRLAREHGAEILSCDSLLVYKSMTIGTAKPTREELESVVHHGIDICEPDQAFTAGDYVRFARPIVDKLVDNGKPLLIVGGTGFYLKALLCGVWDAPPTQPEIRERLEREVAHLDADARAKNLHEKLSLLDAAYAAKIPVNDTYRVIRALEIIEVTGESVTASLAKRQLQNPLPYPFKIFGIKRDKNDLERRIVERTNSMFSQGLVNETKELMQKYSPVPRPLECVGYFEVMQFLKGQMTLPECRERIMISTRQLAKKQMTFFKGLSTPIEWHTLPGEEQTLLSAVSGALRE